MYLYVGGTAIELVGNHAYSSYSMIEIVQDTTDSGSKPGDLMIKINSTSEFASKKVFLTKKTKVLYQQRRLLILKYVAQKKFNMSMIFSTYTLSLSKKLVTQKYLKACMPIYLQLTASSAIYRVTRFISRLRKLTLSTETQTSS
jgi:hypothetical protein